MIGWVIPLAWIVAALRLANPGSWWAKRFYDDRKVLRSEARVSVGAEVEPGQELSTGLAVAASQAPSFAPAFAGDRRDRQRTPEAGMLDD